MQTIYYNQWYINIGYMQLTADEKHHNGMRFAQKLYNYGWTENCIAGILGNVDPESSLSPGVIESSPWTDLPTNQQILNSGYNGGIGFVQWTPGRTKLVQWADDNNLIWYDGTTQVKRLKWESLNDHYDYFSWFTKTTADPADCAESFLHSYERPAGHEDPAVIAIRRQMGEYWYNEIHGKLINATRVFMMSKANRERKELKRRCLRI